MKHLILLSFTRLVVIGLLKMVSVGILSIHGDEVIVPLVQDCFPRSTSKKGLQVEMVDDALMLGVKHAAINVNLSQLIRIDNDERSPEWTMDGESYRFQEGYLGHLDRTIKPLSDQGIVVYLILLTYQTGVPQVDRLMLHPSADPNPPNRLCAFNTATEEGRKWFSATIEFLANRWSQPGEPHGRVAGYILGNEVNSHWWWSNMGPVTMEQFAEEYLVAARLAHRAMRRQSSWARLYVSLEHHWSIRYPAGNEKQAFPGKDFLSYFAKRAREEGDFDWHIAFHPYPENLFEPRFWNDKTATFKADSPRITFKNLEVLGQYLQQVDLLYQGHVRRVILSEQGFHTPDGPDGEALQAAAYCYAYKKVESMDYIDAFILHRHVDHPHEGGLRLGLRRFTPGADDPRPKKLVYECFRLADTPEWESAFDFALPWIGLQSWNSKFQSK